ncbi:MAG: hypothetical protein JW881_10690 [Spirochaetales bacterium]|nr:hypothetical protein [Spirochaetales bacterium]
MIQDVIHYREQVMARANKALDAVWPSRLGEEFVKESLLAIEELMKIAHQMKANDFSRIEQSRTYRFIGCMYSDLMPAKGKDMLLKASEAYQTAEHLLEGQSDELEQAKLYFNFANTLRLIDPNDVDRLSRARKYLLVARAYFATHAPEFLAQADDALHSVEALLSAAPIAGSINRSISEMAGLREKLAAGGDVGEIAGKMNTLMKSDGGITGIMARLSGVIEMLPEGLKKGEKFKEIREQIKAINEKAAESGEMDPQNKQILTLLAERLRSDSEKGIVGKDHAAGLRDLLADVGNILAGDENDINALLNKRQKMGEMTGSMFEAAHYLSHGIERPRKGTRAAGLVELNWLLRRYLLEEMFRTEKGEEERRELLDLNLRAARLDRRIYETGNDDSAASTIEREVLRPLAMAIRNFSARMNTMPAKPVWKVSNSAADTNAVFHSGPANGLVFFTEVCRRFGLSIIAEPIGETYATARWNQMHKTLLAIFDLRASDGRVMAHVMYELGIALTLGKPVLVAVAENQTVPFDIDINPVVIKKRNEDYTALAMAIDQTIARMHPAYREGGVQKTLEFVLGSYKRPHPNIYVDQTLRILSGLHDSPDPLAVTRTLSKLFDYLKDGETMLINPVWPPVFPETGKPMLFHVMPFGPAWADRAREVVRAVCNKAGIEYIRGDEENDPHVIRSIWMAIARSTHVLVDITGFNPNVALELGIAHTLGKNVKMMCQGDPAINVFKSISRFRIAGYDNARFEETLGSEVYDFLKHK